ncbi:hypothetical protein LINPERHAP2_LOCUS32715 [Linum perenne]
MRKPAAPSRATTTSPLLYLTTARRARSSSSPGTLYSRSSSSSRIRAKMMYSTSKDRFQKGAGRDPLRDPGH